MSAASTITGFQSQQTATHTSLSSGFFEQPANIAGVSVAGGAIIIGVVTAVACKLSKLGMNYLNDCFTHITSKRARQMKLCAALSKYISKSFNKISVVN